MYKDIIDNYKIQHMQIQTIDSCDSKCIMCPHKDAPITNKKMDDATFEKIILDVVEAIKAGRVAEDIKIRTYLHNESLLDKKIFDKVAFIKEKIPTSFVLMNTNGFLMPQYKEAIIASQLDEFTWSAYGEQEKLFQHITGVNKAQEELDRISSAFDYIYSFSRDTMLVRRMATDIKIEEIEKRGDSIWDGKSFHSRAGFYQEKVSHDKIYGCAAKGSLRDGVYRNRDRNLSFLNFFANGDSTLCCQDWYRETVMGNIKNQTILEIMESEKWFDIKSKSLGAPSEACFICKRCEFAATDPIFLETLRPKK